MLPSEILLEFSKTLCGLIVVTIQIGLIVMLIAFVGMMVRFAYYGVKLAKAHFDELMGAK